MSEGRFDPAQHLIQLPGRGGKGPTDYLPVAARIAWFRAEHPDGHIVIDHIELTDQRAVFKAEASYPTEGGGRAGGQGYGSETPGDFKDYIEKASTKALGRALATLGYGTLQAGDELDEGARIVDTPQTKPTPRAGTTPGREPAPRSSPQRPTPSDRPAAVPSAAGPPSSRDGDGHPVDATAFWRFAKSHGVHSADDYRERTGREWAGGSFADKLEAVRVATEPIGAPA